MYGLNVIVTPSSEPLSVNEAKQYCRVDADDTSQDDVISDLISEMRERFERIADRSLAEQTLAITLDKWPCGKLIVLPRPPVVTATIQYVDENGDTQTLAASSYTVDTETEPGRIVLDSDVTLPVLSIVPAAVTVTYTAGSATIPPDMKGRLRAAVAYCWENRTQRDEGYIDRLFLPFAVGYEGYYS